MMDVDILYVKLSKYACSKDNAWYFNEYYCNSRYSNEYLRNNIVGKPID